MFKKKILSALVSSIAVVAFAGAASATDYYVNMCGATAQAGFWEKSGAETVEGAFGCPSNSAVIDGTSATMLVIKAPMTNCTSIPSGLTSSDILYVRYGGSSSSGGCGKFNCQSATFAKVDSTCLFNGSLTCDNTESALCQLGCADVACSSLTAVTTGWEHGRKGAFGEVTDENKDRGSAGGYDNSAANVFWSGVVVPMGFVVNDKVSDYVCSEPSDITTTGVDYAYMKSGWECDPLHMTDDLGKFDCRGLYKCIGGICQDGTGTNTCSKSEDCRAASNKSTCQKRELQNVSRIMALHIFSDQVSYWTDFGPSFKDNTAVVQNGTTQNLPIVRCLRNGGSGTLQTLINMVFRGDANLAMVSRKRVAGGTPLKQGAHIWHYNDSGELITDCVQYYAGGIGIADGDKAYSINFTDYSSHSQASDPWYEGGRGVHQLKYEGVEPSRIAIANGKYAFWAAQSCFSNTQGSCMNSTTNTILNSIMTYASAVNLTYQKFGERAYMWGPSGAEFHQQITSPTAYPTRK